MRKLIVGLMLISSVSSFADCSTEYTKAAKNRNIRNAVIIGTASVALAIPFPFTILATTATPSGLSAAAYVTGLMALSGPFPLSFHSNTNFDKVVSAVQAAKAEKKDDASLAKILKMVSKESDIEISDEQASELKLAMVQAFDNDIFCPVVGVKRNGEEKRAAFTRKAVVKYLSNYLDENLNH